MVRTMYLHDSGCETTANKNRRPHLLWRCLLFLFPIFYFSVVLNNSFAEEQKKHDPLTEGAVINLVQGGVPSERIAVLAREMGIGFQVTPAVESDLRLAGATEPLIQILREIAPKSETREPKIPAPEPRPSIPPTLIVESAPDGAQVFVDNELQARAGRDGRVKVSTLLPGHHNVRISKDGFADLERGIDLINGETFDLSAELVKTTPAPAVIQFDHLAKIWHSNATQRDFRVEVSSERFQADWVNIPPAAAEMGSYIHTECHRVGPKWVGSSNINLLFRAPGLHVGKETKMCHLSVQFEVDSVSAGEIIGHSESLHKFDVNKCQVLDTAWAAFTWVPKE